MSQVTFCTLGVLQCWKSLLHILHSNMNIILKTAKQSIYFWHIFLSILLLKQKKILCLLAFTELKTHSRTQSYSVKKAACMLPRRQAPVQGSLVNREGNPSLSQTLTSHSLWRDMWCIIQWCTWHRNASFYSSCHTRLEKHFTNTNNKWSPASITSGISHLLILS